MCTTSTKMIVKLKKVASNLLIEEEKMLAGDHMAMQAEWSKELKAGSHVSMWTRKPRRHMIK